MFQLYFYHVWFKCCENFCYSIIGHVKINRWMNSMTWYANALQISSQSEENCRFLEIWQMLTFWSILTFWPMVTSKWICGWIQRRDMHMLFKFQVNRIKIEDFRHLAYVDLLIYVDIKNNRWFNSVTWYVNAFQISSQSDENWEFLKYNLSCWPLAYVDLLVGVNL